MKRKSSTPGGGAVEEVRRGRQSTTPMREVSSLPIAKSDGITAESGGESAMDAGEVKLCVGRNQWRLDG